MIGTCSHARFQTILSDSDIQHGPGGCGHTYIKVCTRGLCYYR